MNRTCTNILTLIFPQDQYFINPHIAIRSAKVLLPASNPDLPRRRYLRIIIGKPVIVLRPKLKTQSGEGFAKKVGKHGGFCLGFGVDWMHQLIHVLDRTNIAEDT